MKKCSYCGRENDNQAVQCRECGTALENPLVDLPVTLEEKEWIEDSLLWLLTEFGAEKFLSHQTILPEQKFFPDSFRGTDECIIKVVKRVCSYMEIDFSGIEVNFLGHEGNLMDKYNLFGQGDEMPSAAGLYFHPTMERPKPEIRIRDDLRKDPVRLVATIAHELGHVILLGENRISREDKHHEYLTDLITVFYGLGIFTANASFSFSQYQDHARQGWKASRLGYLSEEMFSYGLACCAWMKGDLKPAWVKHLSINNRAYFKQSLNYLTEGGSTKLQTLKT